MKINWKRVVIAGIWAELLLIALYLPVLKQAVGSVFGIIIAVPAWFGSMFLGGLWVTRKIESRFILHGLLVGIVASIVWLILEPIIMADGQLLWWIELRAAIFKVLVCMAGAYVGGRLRKRAIAQQARAIREG